MSRLARDVAFVRFIGAFAYLKYLQIRRLSTREILLALALLGAIAALADYVSV
jgi:hypothetical protein